VRQGLLRTAVAAYAAILVARVHYRSGSECSRCEDCPRSGRPTAFPTCCKKRELIKLASLASAIAGALRQRGVSDPAASLTAEAGIAVFKIAFTQWVDEPGPADLPHIMRESFNELK
jgi:hypothetical protein